MRRLTAVLLILILLFSLSACTSGKTAVTLIYDGVAPASKSEEPLSGNELIEVAENECFKLSVIPDTGYFEVLNLKDGKIYSSYPVDKLNDSMSNFMTLAEMKSTISINYGDKANRITASATSFTDSISLGGHKIHKTENGFVEFFEFPSISITVPVRVSINKNGMVAEVLTAEIEEKADYTVTDISLLKYFGAGGFEDEGYMVVPDGSGAVVNFSNSKHTYPAVSIPIYGSDSVFGEPDVSENKAYMPVFGIKNSDSAFLAVIEKGEACANVNAMVAGNKDAFNLAFPSFNIRQSALVGVSTTSVDYSSKNFIVFDEKEQSLNNIAVRYIFLSGENCDYTGMAKAYRNYLIENKGLKETVKDSVPLYLNMVCSVNVDRNVFGISTKEIIPTAPFESISKYADKLEKSGVDSLKIRLESWSSSDIKNKIYKKADAVKSLGSKDGLLALERAVSKNGGSLYAATDLVHITPANKYGARNVNRRIAEIFPIAWNTLKFDKTNNKNKINLLSPVFFENASREVCKDAAENGYGLSFAVSRDMVYSDFGDNYSKRQQTVKYFESVYKNAQQKNIAIGEQKPMAFTLPYIESAFNLGGAYAANDMEDYQIPFYQLAVSGLISYSHEPINLSLNRKTAFMKGLEYGSAIMYTLITQNSEYIYISDNTSLYNCIADELFEGIRENYLETEEFYSLTGTELVSHSCIGEQVYLSRYSKASAVFNYSEQDFVWNDKTVKAGSYEIFESGARE